MIANILNIAYLVCALNEPTNINTLKKFNNFNDCHYCVTDCILDEGIKQDKWCYNNWVIDGKTTRSNDCSRD